MNTSASNSADEQDVLSDCGVAADPRGKLTPSEHEIRFPGCERPTLGVELEMSLVNPKTRDLVPKATTLLTSLDQPERFKPELFDTIVELNTDICESVSEVRRDLTNRFADLTEACRPHDLQFMCTGTHPSASWRTLPISQGERYTNLIDSMQWPARRLLICGSHFHVGVRSGEHAIALMNSLSVFLPHLLAISSSSPFWEGFDTGMASSRSKVFEGLPTAGLPPRVTNWSEFAQLMRTLLRAGSISSVREIWWDIRPHPGFGTIEVRMCDGINTISEVCALAAFVQCLVQYLQDRYDAGEPMPVLRDWTLRENKWRAARRGLSAKFIRNEHGAQIPLKAHIIEWVHTLEGYGRQLGCSAELAMIERIVTEGANYMRQRRLCEASGSLEGVVDGLLHEIATDTPYGS